MGRTLTTEDLTPIRDLVELLEASNTDVISIDIGTGAPKKISIANLKKTFLPYAGALNDINLGEQSAYMDSLHLSDAPVSTPTDEGALYMSNGELMYVSDSGAVSLKALIDSLDTDKADKDTDAVAGNFAYFDGEGNPVDSGKKDADYEDADITILKQANVVNALDSTSIIAPLSANQGKVLKDAQDVLNGDVSTEGSVLKSIKDNAENATYDNTDSGLSATTLKTAIDENAGNVGNLAGTGRTIETVKGNADAIATLETAVDTNRLYSDQQYLALKAKADSLQVKCNTLQAEVYTDDPILQYGAVEIIGDGYEANDTPIDVSANVVDGKLSMEQKGLTITNLVDNGDFEQGTTGWSSLGGGVPSVTANIASVTGDGSQAYVALRQTTQTAIVGNTYYHSIRVRVTNADCLSIQMARPYGMGGITNPVQNQWYIIPFMGGASSTEFFRIIANYADATTANGKVMEIDGNYGVSAYNLTALGLDHITDTDILAKLLPYVDGTKNVGKMGLRVVNKNLIESVKQIYEGADYYLYTYLDGRFCARFTSGATIEKTPITFLPSQQYTMTFEYQTRIRVAGGSGEAAFSFFYTDGTRSTATVAGNTNTTNWIKRTLTSTSGKTIRSVGVHAIDYRTYVYVSEDAFQLELGATSTTVEPYQKQLTFLPSIGNSLPNGVADSIKTVADGWEHTKRVESGTLSAEKIVNGTFDTDTAWSKSADIVIDGGVATVGATVPGSITQTVLTAGKLYKAIFTIGGYTTGNVGISSATATSGIFVNANGTFTIYFIAIADIFRLVSVTAGVTFDNISVKEIATTAGTPLAISAQTQVYDDGTNGYYQLATPITTHYDLPHLTSGKTIHRFAGEEKISLYGTGVTFTENVLSVLSAVKFVSGEMTDITSLATITTNTVTFSGVSATDVVYVKVEHDVDKPLGVLEHTPAVSNTASRLKAIEDWIALQS